jgi:putative Holliday junction resolvase
MPATPETILALDFGNRRIGVAVGQTVTRSASPLGVIGNSAAGPDWRKLEALIGEWRPARLVVGMPLHADGSPSATTAEVERFVAALARFGLPVATQDERYSSVEAEQLLKDERRSGLRGRISKDAIDSAAAELIAERWLRENN